MCLKIIMRFYSFSFLLILITAVSCLSQDLPKIEKGVSQELAAWRAKNYSDVRYKLNLIIEKKAPTLKGAIEITLNVGETGGNPRVSKGVKIPIILDWRRIKGHEKLSKISNVSVNGKSVEKNAKSVPEAIATGYGEVNEHLIFLQHVKEGENTIKLDFESPILTSGSAITRYIDKEDGSEYIYSLFVPSDASTAFPVFDQPDLKARFKVFVRCPRDWEFITNTSGTSERVVDRAKGSIVFRGGQDKTPTSLLKDIPKVRYFEETKPISTYVFAFAAGPFAKFNEDKRDGLRICLSERKRISPLEAKVYVRKSQAQKFESHAQEIFRLNHESIHYLECYFDYEFPFPKYDLVLIPEFPFGGMEHAGATFLRESSFIFPTEPTADNYISRARLLFHENAHQWFGDTVTMKWFDDLWLKEGFATFMAYKAMEKVLPEYDAWKVFYERTKQRAYLTDVTKGTTPIYQEIPNSAKSAYGNIVYQKAPSFLKQAEFYLGEKEFQTAVRSFLKKHEFANAEWSDLVSEFETKSGYKKGGLKTWSKKWIAEPGLPIIAFGKDKKSGDMYRELIHNKYWYYLRQINVPKIKDEWSMKTKILVIRDNGKTETAVTDYAEQKTSNGLAALPRTVIIPVDWNVHFVFPNYQDYGYGIFLLDVKSKKYILENIQNEKDDFLRSMMWGSLWDSVRFAELAPENYIELAIKNIDVEKDVTTISSILGRVNTAYTYYLSTPQQKAVAPKLEQLLLDKISTSKTIGERITFYRAFLGIASSPDAKNFLKRYLGSSVSSPTVKEGTRKDITSPDDKSEPAVTVGLPTPRTRDKFNIVTRLIVLGDKDAPELLTELEKTEKSDAAKRYAYAAKAGFATKENKEKYWNDFVNNKDISESWIEAAARIWNSPNQSALTLPYLEKALAELPNHKQNRKIFFVNGWLASFIGGQKSEEALVIVYKFLAENPKLDVDLKRKILERIDGLERAVKIRRKYSK